MPKLKTGGARRHGMSESPEYAAWRNMRARCEDAQHPAFADYGGRGIRVCPAWSVSFEAFLADMGPRPTARHSLERSDNDGGYAPGNCVWATKRQQSRNQRTNRIVVYRGRRMPLVDACELAGLRYNTVSVRLNAGWDIERALTEPLSAPNGARPRRRSGA